MLEILALTLIVALAGFLQGLTGFGFGLIALPLLGLFVPIKTIIPLVLLLGVFISLTLSVQLRQSIKLKTIIPLALATVPGIPIGVYALKHISPEALSILLGIIMVCFTSYQLIAKPKPRELGWPYAIGAGFSCGALTGSLGAGGPPAIIYSTIQPWSKDEAKATLAFYFLLGGSMAAASQAYAGFVTSEVIEYFTLSLPALAVGILAGTFSYKRMSDYGYKKLAIILVFTLGWMMIMKNI